MTSLRRAVVLGWAAAGVGCHGAPTETDTGALPDSADSTLESEVGVDSDTVGESDSPDDSDTEDLVGLDLDEVADAKLIGEESDDAVIPTGVLALGGACDVDGDGIDDVVVGMGGHDGDSIASGAMYVEYGPFGGRIDLSEADSRWLGAGTDGAGAGVACLGDTNGDGFGDLLVGVPGYNATGEYEGGAYVLLGPLAASGNLSDADAFLHGELSSLGYSERGAVVAAAGDVNGDGNADMLIGTSIDFDWAGMAFLMYGPVSGTIELGTQSDFRLLGRGGTGYHVASAGDLNADGMSDIVIAQPYLDEGAVVVFDGPVSGSATTDDADAYMDDQGAMGLGGAPTGVGDVDGDGYDDLLIDHVRQGLVYLFAGPVDGEISTSDTMARLAAPYWDAYAGMALSPAGDVNADGFADIAVAVLGPDYLHGPGAAYVVFGPLSGTTSLADANAIYHGEGDDLAGEVLAAGGDVDGDGLDDLLIGGGGDDDGGEDAGAAWLITGASMW